MELLGASCSHLRWFIPRPLQHRQALALALAAFLPDFAAPRPTQKPSSTRMELWSKNHIAFLHPTTSGGIQGRQTSPTSHVLLQGELAGKQQQPEPKHAFAGTGRATQTPLAPGHESLPHSQEKSSLQKGPCQGSHEGSVRGMSNTDPVSKAASHCPCPEKLSVRC